MRESDLPFVRRTWIKELRAHGPDWIRALPTPAFDLVVPKIVDAAIRDGAVRVAAFAEDDETILGFAAVRGDSVLMAYTRASVRRMGVASALLASEIAGEARTAQRMPAWAEYMLPRWRLEPMRLFDGW